MASTNFWVEEPCELFSQWAILPTVRMSKEEKLNALTRLSILVSAIMYAMGNRAWFTFLIVAVLLMVILNYGTKSGTFEGYTASAFSDVKTTPVHSTANSTDDVIETPINTDTIPSTPVREGFSVTPTYVGTDFQQTVVAPTYSEEWQIPPPAYDLYTNVPYTGAAEDRFEAPMRPQSYPYGQYLTKTNLLPGDEYYTHMGCGGPRTAREYINSTFLRNDMARRENMARMYKKSLSRRFRQAGSGDTFSPFVSY